MPLPRSMQTIPDQQPQDNQWQFSHIHRLTFGVNTSLEDNDIEDFELERGDNVRIFKNRVIMDYGYTTFGAAILGTPRKAVEFNLSSGTSTYCLITNSTFYKWVPAAAQWQIVSNGTSTTLTATASATDTSITVASITGFADGELIGILLDDGTQHITTVNGAPAGSTINIDDAIPSTATSGNTVVNGIDLNGIDTKPVVAVVMAANDYLCFTNGVDKIMRFDGSTVEELADQPTSFKCKSLIVWNSYLLALNTEESGTAYPLRVRWCDTGNADNWSTGNAGYEDLLDDAYPIMGAGIIGTRVFIYKTRSITRGDYVGVLNKLFVFQTAVIDEGAVSPNAIISLSDRHVVFGQTGIYQYAGTNSFEIISNQIYYETFAYSSNVNPSQIEKTFGFYCEELEEVWFFYAKTADTNPKSMMRYKVKEGAWLFRDYSLQIMAVGEYITASNLTWQTVIGTWAAQTFAWNSQILQANAPIVHLLSAADTKLYQIDWSTTTDNGTDITGTIETKNFYTPSVLMRIDKFVLAGVGTLTVEYSVDDGITWKTYGSKTFVNPFEKMTYWKQIVGTQIKWRISGTGEFGVEYIGFRWRPENTDPAA